VIWKLSAHAGFGALRFVITKNLFQSQAVHNALIDKLACNKPDGE
jgi:hypothetical protein